MRRAWIVGCLLLLAACSNKETASAVDLSVKYAGYVPKCLRVTVADAKAPGANTSSDTLKEDKLAAHSDPKDRTVRIAVFREKGWSQELKIDVASYSTADCGGTPVETRGLASVTLPAKGSITPEPIVLKAQDADGDGYIAESDDSAIQQDTDCKDNNPKAYPGASAVCDGSGSLDVDFNCDGKDDCNGSTCTSDAMCGSGFCVGGVCCNSACNAPPQCRGAGTCGTGTCVYPVTPTVSCNDGNGCTLNDKCDASGTCGGTPRTCNTAPGQCYGSGGTCNASTGACEYPPLPTTTTCDDANKCTDADKCNGSGGCAGTPRVCNSSPGQCYASTGTCNTSSGACAYSPLPTTATCDDTKICTDADKCDGNGACAGTPRVCNTPPGQCHASTGTCNTTTGACNYAFLSATTSCDDGKDCTSPDKCNGAGACASTMSCAPPNECKEASTTACYDTGACVFDVKTAQVGKVCHEGGRTGTCLPDGTCQAFTYAVTPNFNPENIATGYTLNDLTISCLATLDSTGATPAWSDSGCNIPRPTIIVAGSVVVVAVRNLTVDFPLRLVGTRPVIFAVYGNATLNSELRAHSSRTDTQSGAGSGAGCGSREGKTGADDGKDGSGGGGGGLATMGGKGGDNDDSSKAGGLGGDAAGAGFSPLASGCAGGDGASVGGAVAGKGGAGGGSLQISVAGTLTLKHVVSVSGAGGKGGQPDPAGGKTAGGGGGGSGGMLVLEANSLVVDAAAKLTANGGAGGEGASDSSGALAPGDDGNNGSLTGNSPASGGTDGSVEGGDGGAGAAGNASPGPGAKGTGSGAVHGAGGGGGGSAGRILLRGVTSCSAIPGDAIISPAYANTGGVCTAAP